MDRVNLLKETLDKLQYHGKKPEDVLWVSDLNMQFYTTWSDFESKANRVYDSGFGGVEVNLGLILVGNDWWLERYEYDGAEGWCFRWCFRNMLKKPKKLGKINNIFVGDNSYDDFWYKD